ncbi:MAG: hypothetical protein K6G22_07460 [Lachnospiraceae bacterium]|nr:hypothetical protein [Lachnospiraceae bacterium]
MYKPVEKGKKDYIKKNRIFSLIRTLIMFSLAACVYFIAYHMLGTNKNLFTVMAVLMILPAAKSAVNSVMFFKARVTDEDLYGRVEAERGEIPVLYDLIFTTYEKTYQSDALLYSHGSIILCINADDKKSAAFEDYLRSVIGSDKKYTVKAFNDRQAFLDRISQMKEHFTGADKDTEVLFEKIKAVVL